MIVSKVKDVLQEKCVTYASLQKQTGLDSKTITRARGPLISKCRLSALETIAKALGVGVIELFKELADE